MRSKWDKLAILDVDVHHGNGTQGIFYDRGDVLFASLHGDPSDYFPFFAGYIDETGEGAGAGKTANFPMAQNSGDDVFMESLDKAFEAIRAHNPGALLISLGFDAFENDPIGYLRVTTSGFGEVAKRIAALGLPTLLVQEGGYDCDGLGPNLTSFFAGFDAGRKG
jgi:acetoin utilization deacetylase AcuC-like enzyme